MAKWRGQVEPVIASPESLQGNHSVGPSERLALPESSRRIFPGLISENVLSG